MTDDSMMCSICEQPKLACECDFHPEYLLPDDQEKCQECRGPQERCVCAPDSGAELALTIEYTDVGAATTVVEGPVLSKIDQEVLKKLVEYNFSTTCTRVEPQTIKVEHTQNKAVADYFRQLGYSIVESTASGTNVDSQQSRSDTELYSTQSEGDQTTSSNGLSERSPASVESQATTTYTTPRCSACERSFPERDELPNFCPECGYEL